MNVGGVVLMNGGKVVLKVGEPPEIPKPDDKKGDGSDADGNEDGG